MQFKHKTHCMSTSNTFEVFILGFLAFNVQLKPNVFMFMLFSLMEQCDIFNISPNSRSFRLCHSTKKNKKT